MFIYTTSTLVPTLNTCTHHFDGHTGQVLVADRCAIAFHHIYSFPGKSLDDGQVGLKTRHLLRFEDKRVHTAVELPRQHEADDRWLDVLLVVLVGVKWVPQVLWNTVWNGERGVRKIRYDHFSLNGGH